MSAIEPGITPVDGLEALFRRGTRLAAFACYLAALVVALVLVRPAFRETPATVSPEAPPTPLTDKIRKGESVATFAARHGLGLGELLALNPHVNSLSLERGTKLRIG